MRGRADGLALHRRTRVAAVSLRTFAMLISGFLHRDGSDALAPLPAAGNFAYVGPDESAGHGRIVAVRADCIGRATRVWPMAVESGRSVPRAASLGRLDMEVTHANETMMRAVVAFVGCWV